MQLSNVTVRLGGSQLHTVHKTGVTPAEILVLQKIHGQDAVVDVRPVKYDKNRRDASEFDRLAGLYDRGAAASAIEEDEKSILHSLFPGAMKKLPRKLQDIGLGHLMSPASIAAAEAAHTAVEAEPEPDLGPYVPGEDEAVDDDKDEPEVDPFADDDKGE